MRRKEVSAAQSGQALKDNIDRNVKGQLVNSVLSVK